jgi:hypothetical protein
MGQLVFQATLGGQVNLVGPNTASTFNLNVPAVSSTIASLAAQTFAGTQTFTLDASISGLTVGKGGGAVSTNTAVGASALAVNSSGSSNTALGQNALLSNTTGLRTTAIGHNAGYTQISADSNVFIGDYSGYQVTGNFNNSVGRNALYSACTGASNNAFGYSALFSNTSGANNVAIGDNALQANTTASNNTAVGYQAGYTNATGASQTFIGYLAGRTSNPSSGGQNIGVGNAALYSLTTGTSNTAIGPTSGYDITTGSKNTIIGGYSGNQGGLDIRTASNYIVLSDGDGNPRGVFDSSGNFLVGKTDSTNSTSGVQIYNSSGSTVGRINCIKTASGAASALANYYSGTYVGGIDYSNTATSLVASSDERLKENIVEAPQALNKITSIEVVSYDWKHDPTHVEYGFVAQRLNNVYPEAVIVGDNNEEIEKTWGVEYGRLTPMLVKAIQELKQIVDTQAAEIAELKAKVA